MCLLANIYLFDRQNFEKLARPPIDSLGGSRVAVRFSLQARVVVSARPTNQRVCNLNTIHQLPNSLF